MESRARGVRDIKVDGRETPIRAATVRERSLTVAALSGSMVYARILAIGGHLSRSLTSMSRTRARAMG